MSDDSGASLVLDIQFDDGSVQKGFVRLADLSKNTSKKVGDDFSKTKLIDFEAFGEEGNHALTKLGGEFLKFGLIAGAVGAVIEGIKIAFDSAKEGEKIGAISAQFDNLTKSAGIAGDALKEGLERAADGMIDTDDLLKTANRGLINLGANAARLPEVLDIARKATIALGGSLEERFADITQAIENGNQRALKNNGIILDVEKAYRDFASAIGLTTNELNTAQKQQAILNAVIEQGGEKYKNTSKDVQPLTDNLARLGVAIKEIKDRMAETISQSGIFQAVTQKLVDIAKGTPENKNGQATEIADMIAQKWALQNQINDLIANPGINQRHTDGWIEELRGKISDLNADIAKSGATVVSNSQAMAEEAKKAAEAEAALAAQRGRTLTELDPKQVAAQNMRKLAVEDAANQQALAENAIEESKTQFLLSEYEKRNALRAIYGQKAVLLAEDLRLKEAELEEQFQADQIQTEDEFQAKLLQLRTDYANKKAANDIASIKAQQEAFEQFNQSASGSSSVLAGFSEVISGAKIAATEFAHNAAANFREVGKQMFNSIGQAGGQAFAAFGKAIATGQNALEAFVNSLLASMGQMAVQLGTQFILQGIAYSWAGLPNGPALISAGAALAAFGGILSAVGGGSGSAGGVSDTGGGVASSSGSTTTEVIQPKDLERKTPDTHINLNISGDVLDSDESGMRIVDLINSAFDKNGVRIQSGAVA